MIDFFLPAEASIEVLNPDIRDKLPEVSRRVVTPPADLYLTLAGRSLALADGRSPKQKPVSVEFLSGQARHRQLYGGGRSQSIVKAVGLAQNPHLTILDATAGLGRDAFVLAGLGARVWLLERHPIVRLLLQDGLIRGREEAPERFNDITLLEGNLIESVDTLPRVDVVYLDPMFPERKSKAAVKKDMSLFHDLVGADEDAGALLAPALALAERRVVVKRPRLAPPLAEQKPTYPMVGKSNRFDVYTLKAINPGAKVSE